MTRVIASILAVAAWLAIAPAAPAQSRADTVLVDQRGHEMPASSLKGHFLLVYFGYTSCPDVCPTALTTMSRVLDLLQQDGRNLMPLFVTVDPKRDTVEVMRSYVTHFSPRLIGLTGSAQAVENAQRAFGVTAHRTSAHGLVDHSLFLYFAGPDGRVLETFHATQSAEEIAEAIRNLQAKADGTGAS